MKFSIRDLFLVTVIVALVLGWWVDHRRHGNDVQVLLDVLRREAPWVVENDNADWVNNMMRQEAKARWEATQKNRLPNSSAPAPNTPNP